MSIYKTKVCGRQTRKAKVTDKMLRQASRDAVSGLIDADLGGGLLKMRIARPGKGKSGGFRSLMAYRENGRTVFLDLFAKSDWANIDDDELEAFKTLGKLWLQATDEGIKDALQTGKLIEVEDADDDDEN